MMDRSYPAFGSGARLSADSQYRYELTRRWSNGPACTFIMLNPSTADATLDDPTIRRCRNFAQRWRMGALIVVNLFALRATDPNLLKIAPDPVGPENDDAIHDAVVQSRVTIAAWGSRGWLNGRELQVREMLTMIGRDPMCLGKTKNGCPRHPLYVRASVMPLRFDGV